MRTNVITHADALTYLQSLPDESVHCCITSPPYWNLRDYGVAGQLGLEPTLTEYLDNLTAIFRELRRVLRPDGTLWLNMGDGYAGSWGNYHPTGNGGQRDKSTERFDRKAYADKTFLPPGSTPPIGLKPKDLIGQPWRLAFRLQDDGWWLRSDIIWSKTNPMPESVTDRPTKSHEYIFLMTKSAKYYYDAFAIREAANYEGDTRHLRHDESKLIGNPREDNGSRARTGNPTHGRNKRTVWTVATHPLPQAHFASFPPKLIEPMILAGCPPKVCADCGAPWERVVESESHYTKREAAHHPGNTPSKVDSTGWEPPTITVNDWQPTCDCDNPNTEPGIVLDPFMGAGTVALVAIQHGRGWLGCELNGEYIAIANERISAVQVDMFTSVGL